MTSKRQDIDELDLISLADGGNGVSEERLSELDRILRQEPEAKQRLEQYRAQNEALHAAFNARALEPVPDRLLAALTSKGHSWKPTVDWTLGAAVAMSASIALAAVFAFYQHRSASSDLVINAAVSEYRTNPQVDTQMTGSHVSGSRSQGTPIQSSSEALPSWVPDMEVYGYRFKGTQHLRLEGRNVMRVDYGSSVGGTVTLFLAEARDSESAGVEVKGDGTLNWAHWKRRPVDAVVVTTESRDIAAGFARLVRERIDKGRSSGDYADAAAPINEGMVDPATTPAAAAPPLIRDVLPLCGSAQEVGSQDCTGKNAIQEGSHAPPVIR
jgi:anti-sigma factor RsiW